MLAAVIEVAASKGAKRRGFIVQAPSVRGWESQARRRGHREIPPSRRPPRAGHARQERRRRNHARHARQTFRRSASACRNRRYRTAPTPRDQIGRASCRERVWQYVSMSVVTVSLKNNINTNNEHETKNTLY